MKPASCSFLTRFSVTSIRQYAPLFASVMEHCPVMSHKAGAAAAYHTTAAASAAHASATTAASHAATSGPGGPQCQPARRHTTSTRDYSTAAVGELDSLAFLKLIKKYK